MQKIKCLYIHGLDSFLSKEKLAILENEGFEVFSLTIDYRNQNNTFQLLEDEALEKKVQFIIGSSMGGFLGYWLAEKLSLPCLLYNPALAIRERYDNYLPLIETNNCPLRIIVIGANDDVVLPHTTFEWLRQQTSTNTIEKIMVFNWLAHQIDYNTFQECTVLALAMLKNNKMIQEG